MDKPTKLSEKIMIFNLIEFDYGTITILAALAFLGQMLRLLLTGGHR